MHGLYKSRKKMLASTLHLTTTPADHHPHQKHPMPVNDCQRKPPPPQQGEQSSSQDPTACRRLHSCTQFHIFKKATTPHDSRRSHSRRSRDVVLRRKSGPPHAGHLMATSHTRNPRRSEVKLLRKEVIQPHLPVRLPCYDFTPVTSPTFDGSLPCGLGHRLRVLLTPVV